jgi:hypothetical protein
MNSKPNSSNKRARKSVTVRAAWVGGGCAVAAAIIAAVLPPMLNGNSSGSNSSVTSSVSPATDGPLVAVRREVGVSSGCGSWIVPKAPQDVSPLSANADGETWVAKNQAIDSTNAHLDPSEGNVGQDVAVTNLDVTIQGASAVQIILTGMQFVVVHRGSGKIKGGLVTEACGGQMEGRYMVVDLDNRPVNIVASARDPDPATSSQSWQGTPVAFPYYVADTSGEVFRIIAFTHGDVTWYAKLFWSVDGKNGQSIISDGGRPFETAVLDRATAVYGYNGHGWYVCSNSVSVNSALQCAAG